MKVCNKCSINKPLDQFFNDRANKTDGKYSICKECKKVSTYEWRKNNPETYNKYAIHWRDKNPDKQHANEVKRRYGISIEEYNRLLTLQNCSCKVCGKPHDTTKKRGRLYVDHCHTTGKVRGLLCSACNSALGYVEDKEQTLLNLIQYLKQSA